MELDILIDYPELLHLYRQQQKYLCLSIIACGTTGILCQMSVVKNTQIEPMEEHNA